ncbi:MAG TPA: hypothetical protein DEB39_10040, partial [Planctomycetaceae bacterium]|nr:hypothetical protein [Planctomycetaceae bacterium]
MAGCSCSGGSWTHPAPIPLPESESLFGEDKRGPEDKQVVLNEPENATSSKIAEPKKSESSLLSEVTLPSESAGATAPTSKSDLLVETEIEEDISFAEPIVSRTPVSEPLLLKTAVSTPKAARAKTDALPTKSEKADSKPRDHLHGGEPVRNILPVRNISPIRNIPPIQNVVPVQSDPSRAPVSSRHESVESLYRPVKLLRFLEEDEIGGATDDVPDTPMPEVAESETQHVDATVDATVGTSVDTDETGEMPADSSAADTAVETAVKTTVETDQARRPEPVSQPSRETPAGAVPGGERPGGWTEKKHVRFNFRYQPWKEVIPWFAELADLSLELNTSPPGTLNLTDPNYYTPEEALDILNSILLFKEYTLIRKGRMLFVIYLPDGIPPNLLEPIDSEELDKRGKYELVRVLFNLNRTTPEIIQAEVEKMLGPQGSIVMLPKSQQVLITETGGNLRAIREVIRRIDDPSEVSSSAINMIEMKNMSADEALAILRKLLGIEENDPSLRTAVDASGSKIWLTGRADMIERAKEIIGKIDGAYDTSKTKLDGEPQFETYDVGSADANTVLAVLQTLLVGIPDVRLSIDPKTGGLAVLARMPEHRTVKATISQMQLNAPVVEVIPLVRLAPSAAAEAIRKILTPAESNTASGSEKTVGRTPPVIEPDTANRQLIVRGTPNQVDEVRAILMKLGETGSGVPPKDERTIRQIPLSSTAAALVLEQLKEIWPELRSNELKVVPPSAMVPAKVTTELPGAVRKPETEERTNANPERDRAIPGDRNGPDRRTPDRETIDRLIEDNFRTNRQPYGPTTRRDRESRFLPVVFVREHSAEHPNGNKNGNTDGNAGENSDGNSGDQAAIRAEIERLRDQLQRDQHVRQEPSSARPAEMPVDPMPIDEGAIRNAIEWIRERRAPADQSAQADQASPAVTPVPDMQAVSPPVVVSLSPGGLMISSDDPEALARLEELIRMLSDESVLGKTQTVVYYLKNSTAEVVAQTLKSIMGSGGSDEQGNMPSLESEHAPAILAMLDTGASFEATGTPSIIPESRLNALIIQANPVDHRTIEKLLPLLDQPGAPGGDIQNRAKPHLIPLQNIRAEDALAVVKEVFASKMEATSGSGNAGGNRQQQNQGARMPPMMPPPAMMAGGPAGEMMRQVMARMTGRGGSGTQTTVKEETPKMSLSIDARSNSLIVNSPESLFLEVEAFVLELDRTG